jgi:phosphoribosylamine-glycine ligase
LASASLGDSLQNQGGCSEFGAGLSRRREHLTAADSRVLEVMGPQVDVMTGQRAARWCLAELDEACVSLSEGWDEETRRKDIRPGRA